VRDDPAYPLPRDPNDARRWAQARADLAERLTAQRGAPTAFLAALFAAGEAAHERQARRLLGSAWEAGLQVADFARQVDDFTACFEALRRLPPRTPTATVRSGGGTAAAVRFVGPGPAQGKANPNAAGHSSSDPAAAAAAAAASPAFGTCPQDDLTAASSARRVCTAKAREQQRKTNLPE
jgi:hypothetical protein